MYSFLLDGRLGQFRIFDPVRQPVGRLQVPLRRRPRPIQNVPRFTQYAVQVYVLPGVGFTSAGRPPPDWRQVDSRTFETSGLAAARQVSLCRVYLESNRRMASYPTPGRMRSVVRDPYLGYDYQTNGGDRTIVRMFSSSDNFATSQVVTECDVPRWQDT